MAVRYVAIDGEMVSAQWHSVIAAMRRDGVHGNVNEGHRTFARQAQLYALYRSGRGNLAAVPSPNAPHIRTGRTDHAVDFGNDAAVFAWLSRKGLAPQRTVRGESWHIEVSAAKLNAFYSKHGPSANPLSALSKNGQKRASKLLFHRREMNRFRHGRSKAARQAYASNLRWARYYKARLVASWRVSTGAKRKTLERVIKATDGTL
jgi:hypothetical protein